MLINRLVDSLNSIYVSAADYRNTLVSVYTRLERSIVKERSVWMDSSINAKLTELEKIIEKKRLLLDSLASVHGKASIEIPERLNAKLPSVSHLSAQTRLPHHGSPTRGRLGLPIIQLPKPNLDVLFGRKPDNLSYFKNLINSNSAAFPRITELAARAKAIQTNLQKLKDGNAAEIDRTFDQQLGHMEEMLKFKQGASKVEAVKGQASSLTNSEVAKDKIRKKVEQKYIDHFAGHEDKIKSETESMEKLQRKYHSLKDVRYPPKRRSNPESERTFMERIIFGSEFQIERSDPVWTGLHISPYLGYWFSDRFRLAIGGTESLSFDVKSLEIEHKDESYGYRIFGNYKVIRGLFSHLEFENIYRTTPVYSGAHNLSSVHSRQWDPSILIGLFKTFSISSRISGQSQFLYDLFDVTRNFRFNQAAFRFGFEYRIAKKTFPNQK